MRANILYAAVLFFLLLSAGVATGAFANPYEGAIKAAEAAKMKKEERCADAAAHLSKHRTDEPEVSDLAALMVLIFDCGGKGTEAAHDLFKK